MITEKKILEITNKQFDKYSFHTSEGVLVITENDFDYLVEELIKKLTIPDFGRSSALDELGKLISKYDKSHSHVGWDKLLSKYGKEYNYPKPSGQITITIPHYLTTRNEIDDFVSKKLNNIL